MSNNIDLVEKLKNCPRGTKLYCPLFGEVELQEVNDTVFSDYPINVITYHYTKQYPNGHPVLEKFTSDGRYLFYCKNNECVLFPSKDQRDWNKWEYIKLKKVKFNPNVLKPFDKVLVRDYNDEVWFALLFSHINNKGKVNAEGCIWEEIVPYNDDTKHLIGTTKEAPEYYRYWED